MALRMTGRWSAASATSVLLISALACSTSRIAKSSQQTMAQRATASGVPPFELTEEDSRWSHLHREHALDALMPLRSDRVIVTYRAAHTIVPGEIENYFAIDWGKGYRLYGATVITPVGKSIGEQLIRLHRAEPDASFESVLSRIRVDRRTTDVEACPGLFTRMGTLHRVRVPMFPDPNVIHLDGMQHRIVVDGFVDVSDSADDHPAAVWAQQMFATLKKCVQGR